jgi:hypothetical protein
MYRNRRHDAGVYTNALQCILQGQGIHHRGKHSHVITGNPVDARFSQPGSAKNVSTAYDDRNLYIRPSDITNFDSDPVYHFWIDAVILFTQQGFTAEF